jgi:putative ABC transport system ATP-binding protein
MRGEFLAIMGASGSGKSTLMNLLGCLDTPTSGSYTLDGVRVDGLGKNELAAIRSQKLGFVFQGFNLLGRTSAVENVELPLLICGERPDVAKKRAMDLLTTVGLKERATLRPAALSGGERQRVTIARALANEPALVWADEPTGDLDKKTADDVVNLMRKLNRDNKETFIIVTHDPEVGAQCDRIIHMRDGSVISENGHIGAIKKDICELG